MSSQEETTRTWGAGPVALGLDVVQLGAAAAVFWGLLLTTQLWAPLLAQPWICGPAAVLAAPAAVLAFLVGRRGLWVRLDTEDPHGLEQTALGCLREGRVSGRAAAELAGSKAAARAGPVPDAAVAAAITAVRLRPGRDGRWQAVAVLRAGGSVRPHPMSVVI